MNAGFLLLTAAFQLAALYVSTGESALLLPGTMVVAIFGMFAFTRLDWGSHLDMALLMAGPGGLAMMLPALVNGQCHAQAGWGHYLLMSAGMLAAVPLCWRYARCIREARREGHGLRLLVVDLLGMQAGMALAHLPFAVLPLATTSLWVQHVTMLAGMLFGMMTAHYSAEAYFLARFFAKKART